MEDINSRPGSRLVSRGSVVVSRLLRAGNSTHVPAQQSCPESSLSLNAGDDSRGVGTSRRASQASVTSEVQAQPRRPSDQTSESPSTTNRLINRLARSTETSDRPPPIATSRSGRNLASIASISDTAFTSSESYADSSPTPSLDGTPTPAPRNVPRDGVFKRPTALTSAIHASRTGGSSIAADNAPQREQAPLRQEQPARNALSRQPSVAPSTTNDGGMSRSRAASVISRTSSRMSEVPDAFDDPNEMRKPPMGETGSRPLAATSGATAPPVHVATAVPEAQADPQEEIPHKSSRECSLLPYLNLARP